MESFEELELSPELVEALAAEGIETPTSLQANAIPVLRRGGSVVLLAGPGAGSFATYSSALLDRIEAGGNHPRAIVISVSRERSRALALALARLALATGHRVGALGVPWAFPERADILFTTLDDLEKGVRSSEVKIEKAAILVLDGASALLETESDAVSRVLLGMEREGFQFVLVTDAVTPPLRSFVEQHGKRAVFLPAEAASFGNEGAPVQRGVLRVRTVDGEKEDALPELLLEIFGAGSAHTLLFAHSEDRAADAADFLALHGFTSGAPGDLEVPVWLGVEPLEARAALKATADAGTAVTTVSIDPPLDADELDRRHGGAASSLSAGGIVLAHPRELPHLRRIAHTAGYTLEILAPSEPSALDEASRFVAEIERTIAGEDLLPHLVLLEPLLRSAGSAQVAAALSFLIRKRAHAIASAHPDREVRSETVSRPPSWAHLFLSVGEKDGITTRDLLGAILGESGIAGEQVGKIDLRETFTKVEVQEPVADKVIRALNGTSIRGRSVRADFDRGDSARSAPRSSGGPRNSGGPRSSGGARSSGGPRGETGEGGRERPSPSGFRGPRPDGGGRSAPAGRGKDGPARGTGRPRPEGDGRSAPAGRGKDGPARGTGRPRPEGGGKEGAPYKGPGRPSSGRPSSGSGGKGGAPYKGSGSRPSSGGGGKSGGGFRKGPETGGKPRRSDSPKPRRPS